jgi:hypothetical protein
VTELRELAGGRADLLAQVAGIFEGTSDGELDEPLARHAAHLCRLAGADETLIPQWIAEGRRKAEAARIRPHSGQPRGSHLQGTGVMTRPVLRREQRRGTPQIQGPGGLSAEGSGLRALSLVAATSAQA